MVKWVEYYVQEQYENQGYDVIHTGVPDLILLKDGKIEFVEVKMSSSKHLSESQERAVKLLRKHGFKVRIEIVPKITIPRKFISKKEQLEIISAINSGKLEINEIYNLIMRSQRHPQLKNFTHLLISFFNAHNDDDNDTFGFS